MLRSVLSSKLQCCSRQSSVFQFRQFAAAKPQVAVKAEPAATESEKAKLIWPADDAPLGHFYHYLLYNSRGPNRLALGDLRKLLQKCKEPEHLKYAIKGVQLYQKKGQDFSVEVNSHFVKVCIDAKSPASAADEFVKQSSRIGAWTSVTAFHHLTEALEQQSADAKLMIDMFHTLSGKGVKAKKESAEIILKAAATCGDAELYTRAVEGASRMLDELTAKELAMLHPFIEPPAKTEEATAPAGDAAVEGADAAAEQPAK